MSELVATIYNQHVADCGVPPRLDNRDHPYLSVFQNKYGEQMVFYQLASGQTYVRLGDAGWDDRWRVVAGLAPGLTLGPDEARFVMSCWNAATQSGSKHADGELHDAVVLGYCTLIGLRDRSRKEEFQMLQNIVYCGLFQAAMVSAAIGADSQGNLAALKALIIAVGNPWSDRDADDDYEDDDDGDDEDE